MAAIAQNYDRFKTILQGDDATARITLALDPATPPEVLYFLCDDASADVRRAVAENRSTPSQADARLARDTDVSVRCALARKAVGDGLGETERTDLWRMGFTILETLMRDQVVRVRRVLAESLATDPGAPHGVVLGLARDHERMIAAPVLKGSPVLTDDDMLTILDDDAPDWAQQAIAERDSLSPALNAGLARHASRDAASYVVANPNATPDEPAMDVVVEGKSQTPGPERGAAGRPGVTRDALVQLARAFAAPLLGRLWQRPAIAPDGAPRPDPGQYPLEESPAVALPPQGAPPARPLSPIIDATAVRESTVEADESHPRPTERARRSEESAARARKLHNGNALTDNAVALALESGDTAFVVEALALRSGMREATVRRMIDSNSARTVVALAWKAGFGARFAMDLQRRLAHIPPARILNARGGVDFALTPAEMKEQLAFFS